MICQLESEKNGAAAENLFHGGESCAIINHPVQERTDHSMENKLRIPAHLEAMAAGNERIGKLVGTVYGRLLTQAYAELDTEMLYRSPIHGIGHIERTMLLGALIAQAQALPENETRMLLLCCSYHDVGRCDDFKDDGHGANSAHKIRNTPLREKFAAFDSTDFTVMQAAVTTHSVSDRYMERTAEWYFVGAEKRELYFRLARCLKDADNLDRVRLGDLQTSHLRHPESVAMAQDAQWFYDEYNKWK